MQPYFFPYLGYFQLLNLADLFVIYDDVNFIKRGWVNRNNLLVNGRVYLFSVPLHNASQNELISVVALDEAGLPVWRDKFLQTLTQAYKKAPYFGAVQPLVEEVLFTLNTTIAQLAASSLQAVASYLELSTALQPSSVSYNNAHLKGQARILDICQQEGATHYVNPTGGSDLYDAAYFSAAGIDLKFIKPQLPMYPQLGKQDFMPSLSIIDVLMNNSRDAVRAMLQSYVLESN